MNVTALLAQARALLDDEALPYKWSDALLISYIDEAQHEACLRANLLYDANTTAYTRLSLVAPANSGSLDTKVIYVMRASGTDADVSNFRLTKVTREELDRYYGNWETATGRPTHYIVEQSRLTVYPAPAVNTQIDLGVYRYPVTLTTGANTPEIDSAYHPHLIDWVVYRCARSRDQDFELPEAQIHLERFERVFGRRPMAKTIRAWQSSRTQLCARP